MAEEPKFYQGGGMVGGRRSEGAEPRKRKAALKSVKLNEEQLDIASGLVSIAGMEGRLRQLAQDKDDYRKNYDVRIDGMHGTISCLANSLRSEYAPNSLEHFQQRFNGIPGVSVVGKDASKARIVIAPDVLHAYLNSDETNDVLQAVKEHQKSLPVSDYGRGHPDKLAGLGLVAQLEIAEAKKHVLALKKEVLMQKYSGPKTHPHIAEHDTGGLSH